MRFSLPSPFIIFSQVDFDRWKSPDDEEEITADVMKDFPDIMERVQREEYGYKVENLRKVYLFLYNLFQFVGYLFIVGVLSVRYLRDGQGSLKYFFN